MSIIKSLKRTAQDKNILIQDSDSAYIQGQLNQLFYADKRIQEEADFVKAVMTRGFESQERVGLHASDMIGTDKGLFCPRRHVLSLLYKGNGDRDVPINLMRIFEEGNAVHEKWQRLFIRGGLTTADQCDVTQWHDGFMLSYTPDIIFDMEKCGRMVCEIKSQNTFTYKKETEHISAFKQLQWYMFLTGIHQGIVLVEDKNSQDFRVQYYKYDSSIVAPFVERGEKVMYYYEKLIDEKKMVGRIKDCNSPMCKSAVGCPMREACFNVGKGRIRLSHIKPLGC